MAIANAVNAQTAGIQSLTSAGVWNGRTITAGTGISITNGDGIAGNPTVSLSPTEAPIGSMAYFATANNETYPNPTWLKCDGSIVNQADYPTLYQRVGLINEAGTNFTTNITATITGIQPAIAFGNSVFASVGAGGTAYTTTDGITFTSQTTGTSSSLRCIIYGGGIFVAAGFGGVLATSTDAVTWTLRTSGTTSSINTLLYGNSLYVYGTIGGGLSTSTDAITWTARTSGTTSSIYTMIYNSGLYVYGGTGGTLATSTDAITWTSRSSLISATISAVWYGNSLYHAVSVSQNIATSTDAITWKIPRQDPNNFAWENVLPQSTVLNINGVYLATNQNLTKIYTSTDALNFKYQSFERTTSVFNQNISTFAWDGANKIVAVGPVGGNFYGSVYSYNTATQFKLPTQYFYNQDTTDNVISNLYIKAL
jgi:hypothetical protein